MQKAHSNIDWKNFPNLDTPVNEYNLNKMDNSIDIIDDRVIYHETSKLDKTDAEGLFKDVSFDPQTGIFTFVKFSGATKTIDTLLEKIAVNFDFDEVTQKIIIYLEDGTTKEIDLRSFVTQYEFLESDTIAFQLQPDGKVTAIIKEGSIEEKHLRPDYLADIRVESAKAENQRIEAENARESAEDFSKLSESYARGGTGTREGEDSDNAKEYAKQAHESAEKAAEIAGGEFVPLSDKGKAGGVATLDSSGKVPSEQLPEIGGAVTSVNGKTGKVEITKADIGLANVDNTADKDKNVNSAQKLGSVDIGSITKPIYLDKGTPKPCTYTLGQNVPTGGTAEQFLRGDGVWAIPEGSTTTSRLVCKSSSASDIGKTVKVTDGSKTWQEVFDVELSVIFTLPGMNIYTISLIGMSGEIEYEENISIGSGEYKFIEIGYSKNTFSGIQAILNAHKESEILEIGDEIPLTLTNDIEMVYQVGGINIYDEHDVIFVPKRLLPDTRIMRSSPGGYGSSNLYLWLNNDFIDLLPNEIKEIIVYTTQYTAVTMGSANVEKTTGKILLPTVWEVFGNNGGFGSPYEHLSSNSVQWPIFAIASNRIKGNTSGNKIWWTASPSGTTEASALWNVVNNSGTASGIEPSYSLGVLPCFRIKAQM